MRRFFNILIVISIIYIIYIYIYIYMMYNRTESNFWLKKINNTLINSKEINNIPLLLSKTSLPDVEFGEKNKGFTCTGLSYEKDEDVFYVGNIGKTLPTSNGFKSTIVKLSKNGTVNLGEIKLYDIFPTMLDIQGITIDKNDDTIWFCSTGENKIRHITKAGVDIESIDLDRPTGIVYDNRTNTLWVLTYTKLLNINKDGKIIDSINISIEGQDQLFLDESKNIMYFTAGVNYHSDNYVYKIDLSTKKIDLVFKLKDSYCVEGIYIENGIMYILNDGYYHSGKNPINQLNKYDINQLLTEKQYKELI